MSSSGTPVLLSFSGFSSFALGLPNSQLPFPSALVSSRISGSIRTKRLISILPKMSGNNATLASARFTVTISGFEPQDALAKVTPFATTAGESETARSRSPAIFISRPVAAVTFSAIKPLY